MKATAASSNVPFTRVTEQDTMTCDSGQGSPVRLTQRQLEVLALLCEGLSNKHICRQLNISTGTVKAHVSLILRQLGVSSRLQAVLAAQRYGLLGESGAGAAEGTGSPPEGTATMADEASGYGAGRQVEMTA